MTKTLLQVIIFVLAIAALPWVINRIRQRRGEMQAHSGTVSRVVSAIAVGPHQRVVTVEIGAANQCVTLVLGVTAQNISCLHTAVSPTQESSGVSPGSRVSFNDAMESARHSATFTRAAAGPAAPVAHDA